MTPHGTPGRYNNGGCRCDPCRAAARTYHSELRARKAKPTSILVAELPPVPAPVPVATSSEAEDLADLEPKILACANRFARKHRLLAYLDDVESEARFRALLLVREHDGDKSSLSTWIYSFLTKRLIDWLRENGRPDLVAWLPRKPPNRYEVADCFKFPPNDIGALGRDDKPFYDPPARSEESYSFEVREAVNAALAVLNSRERAVYEMYHGHDCKMHEIGWALGLSESRVCQIVKQSEAKLRERFAGVG